MAPGHTGCINALSWARDGEFLLSGGDDTTVRMWAIDAADASQEYPFTCRSVVRTGHRANIFGVQMLPSSNRIATAAGDKQVRVFDIGEECLSSLANGSETIFNSCQVCIRVLRCHEDRVKRIVTEHSPDLFLSVGEDGSVRQHDLRLAHDCPHDPCPTPLAKVNHELSTLALSPLTPYQFVVAGESPYGYLFDRRQSGRVLQEEWGVVPNILRQGSLTNCVLRFGRRKKAVGQRGAAFDHITGARMSSSNGHEVLLSYSADAVYLYSTSDNVVDKGHSSSSSSILRSALIGKDNSGFNTRNVQSQHDMYLSECDKGDNFAALTEMENDTKTNVPSNMGNWMNGEDIEDDPDMFLPNVPVLHPRQRYAGARNTATIKDVNFLGPHDDFVVSGSDDGNFFIWRKSDGTIYGIYEGDGNIVNVVEGHPHLPLVAVSGIDTTIKLFAPTSGHSNFSKTENAAQIIEMNAVTRRPTFPARSLAAVLLDNGIEGAVVSECPTQ